jgi:hypothetical protein
MPSKAKQLLLGRSGPPSKYMFILLLESNCSTQKVNPTESQANLFHQKSICETAKYLGGIV